MRSSHTPQIQHIRHRLGSLVGKGSTSSIVSQLLAKVAGSNPAQVNLSYSMSEKCIVNIWSDGGVDLWLMTLASTLDFFLLHSMLPAPAPLDLCTCPENHSHILYKFQDRSISQLYYNSLSIYKIKSPLGQQQRNNDIFTYSEIQLASDPVRDAVSGIRATCGVCVTSRQLGSHQKNADNQPNRIEQSCKEISGAGPWLPVLTQRMVGLP